MPNPVIHRCSEYAFTFSCVENGVTIRRELTSDEKTTAFVIALFTAPALLFLGAIPVFFLVLYLYKCRHEGYVHSIRARKIHIEHDYGTGVPVYSRARRGRPARVVNVNSGRGLNPRADRSVPACQSNFSVNVRAGQGASAVSVGSAHVNVRGGDRGHVGMTINVEGTPARSMPQRGAIPSVVSVSGDSRNARNGINARRM